MLLRVPINIVHENDADFLKKKKKKKTRQHCDIIFFLTISKPLALTVIGEKIKKNPPMQFTDIFDFVRLPILGLQNEVSTLNMIITDRAYVLFSA